MSVQDTALRMALRAMLADVTYNDAWKSQPWVEAQLAQGVWTDTSAHGLKTLAIRWAQHCDTRQALALRKALGEALTADEEAVLALGAKLPSARGASHAHQGETTMRRVVQPRAKGTPMTDLYGDPQALQDLHQQAEYMNTPPYNTPPAKHAKALAAVQQGRVSQRHDHVWQVQGSKDSLYEVTEDGCTCPNGQKTQKTKYGCYHAVAVELYRRWHRAMQPILLSPQPSAEERLARRTQQPDAATIPTEDDAQGRPAPETIVGHSGAKQDVSMATTTPLSEDESLPEPADSHPNGQRRGGPLALPRRSISAIVADLSRPLPQACIATKTQGGQTIPFLHWQTVARVLDAYAPGWHGRVVRVDVIGTACAITYRLTVPCLEGDVVREATGQEEEALPERAYGDSTSNAEAMAFKRAAAKFGVGLWLYDKPSDTTARALAEHFKAEKTTALAELGKVLDEAGLNREHTISWLRRHTGATRNSEIPLAAIKALMGHLAGTHA